MVGVTRPIVEDLGVRLGVRAELISNGWDPEMEAAPRSVPEGLDARRFTFLHTGAVSGVWGRDPRPLLSAFRRLVEAEPELRTRIEAVFVGAATADDLELLHQPDLQGVVRYAGSVDRSEVFALQRAAGALLLMTSDRVSEATGKLFEYLGSGRPIIALAEGNEAARIVEETGTGVCVAPADVPAITAQLRRAIDGELERDYAPRDLDRYRYPAPAERMASSPPASPQSGRRATACSRSPAPSPRSSASVTGRVSAQSPEATRSPMPLGNRQRPNRRYCSEAGRPTALDELDLTGARAPRPESARSSATGVKCTRCRGRSRWYQQPAKRLACQPPRFGTVTITRPPGASAPAAARSAATGSLVCSSEWLKTTAS